MSHGRVLVEEFEPDVLKWLRSKVELFVVDPWVEPERWDLREARRMGSCGRGDSGARRKEA